MSFFEPNDTDDIIALAILYGLISFLVLVAIWSK